MILGESRSEDGTSSVVLLSGAVEEVYIFAAGIEGTNDGWQSEVWTELVNAGPDYNVQGTLRTLRNVRYRMFEDVYDEVKSRRRSEA